MEVTTAMLADAATVAEGKLYIHGGGWNSIISPQIPTTHPTLALVVVFKLDWHEANEDLELVIELVTEDGEPAGLRGDMHLRVAPTPLTKKGAELYQSTAYTFHGLQFDKYGGYRFQITYADKVLAAVPLSILPPVASAAA
jgi:hypothetical protein